MGYRDDIPSNQGLQFVSHFWKELFKLLEVALYVPLLTTPVWADHQNG